MRLTQSVLAAEETLAPAEETWQLALTERDSFVGRQSSGSLQNFDQAPVSVVAMTAEFQVVVATPTVATPTGS